MADFYATVEIEILGDGFDNLDDDVFHIDTGMVQAGDVFNGGLGVNTLLILEGASVDFSGASFTDMSRLVLSGWSTAAFDASIFALPGNGALNVVGTGSFFDGAAIVINKAANFSAAAWTFTDWLAVSHSLSINGTSGHDSISGSSMQDMIVGGSGNDVIAGNGGNDVIHGGSGSDFLSGNEGNDTIHAVLSDGADQVSGGDGTDLLHLYAVGLATGLNIDLTQGGGGANIGDGSAIDGIEQIQMDGGSGNDAVTGGGLADGLRGHDGNDTLSGAGGNDALEGGGGDDSLSGGEGDDALFGGGGANTLSGGGGDDYIQSDDNGLADAIDGGSGFDELNLDRSSATQYLALNLTWAGIADLGDGTSIFGIEKITFNSGSADDVLVGGEANDVLRGGGGNDLINGHFGLDVLEGGDGDDIISSYDGQGRDLIDGGSGVDFLRLERWSSTVQVNLSISDGGGGRNIGEGTTVSGIEQLNYYGSLLRDTITGGGLDDYIVGNEGDDILTGGGGNDQLFGYSGKNQLYGGDGDDSISSGFTAAGGDLIDGGLGTDFLLLDRTHLVVNLTVDISNGGQGANFNIGDGTRISSVERLTFRIHSGVSIVTGGGLDDDIRSGNSDDILNGGAGDDVLDGGTGANQLFGGDGHDQIISRGTGETINGGAGVDHLFISRTHAASGLVIDITAGGQGLGFDIGDGTTISNFERLNADGSSYGDQLLGGSEQDFFNGDGGDDLLSGGAGDDLIFGGEGNDTIDGGDGHDTLYGDAGFDVISGGEGNDVIFGFHGTGTFDGGAGDDFIHGGEGAATMQGGAGIDTLSYIISSNGVTVSLQTGLASGGNAAGDSHAGFENLVGGSGNDSLTGSSQANILQGGVGDDRLTGLGGADEIDGGRGRDTASYKGSAQAVIINLATGFATGGAANGDTLASIEDLIGSDHGDLLTGNAEANKLTGALGDDQLSGGDGDDTLLGGDGADILIGGAGKDRMTGGPGADVFTFLQTGDSPPGNARDIVVDFTLAQGDRIDLSAIDAVPGASDDPFAFIGLAAFSDEGQIGVVQSGANTLVYVNTAGKGTPEMILQLQGISAASLTASDFIL